MISASAPGIIGRTHVELRDDELTLVMPEDMRPLAGDRLMRRMRQLAKIGGWNPAIAIEG